jgi:ABC-type transport system involved in multi-copper enzyme maturation permease subunit
MNLPAALFAVRCLARDKFRQSLATRTFWLILGASGLCILLCLSVGVEGATAERPPGEIELFGRDRQPFTGLNRGEGYLTIGFGAIRLRQFRDGEAEVRFLELLLAKWGAGAIGTLLALLWTAGFLPEFLRPEQAAVLLAKPVPRWSLLAGKFVGVLAFVSFQAAVFVGGTWLALGSRTGFWHPGYLATLPLVVLQFAVLYSFSALLAAWTRSTILCILGTVVFWGACSAVNVARHVAIANAPSASSPIDAPALEAAYWLLPKPADLAYLFDEALEAGRHFRPLPALETARERGAFDPGTSLVASLAAGVCLLGMAARRFARADY